MKRNSIVAAGLAMLLAAGAAAQTNPQERGRREAQATQPAQQPSPSSQPTLTVPPAQQPQQPVRERVREQPPVPQAESAQGQQPHRGPAPEEKTSVTHHSAHIGGQQINYTATAATYVIKS